MKSLYYYGLETAEVYQAVMSHEKCLICNARLTQIPKNRQDPSLKV